MFATEVVNIVAHLFAGPLYDIFGRRKLIFISTLLMSVSILSMPYAGSVSGLLLARCGVALTSSTVISAPLVIDAIDNQSKGKAVGMAGFGVGLCAVLITAV